MADSSERARVAIVGGGPIGLELAAALAGRGISFVQFEAEQIGHTMSWWAPQTRWFSSNERIAIGDRPLVTIDQSKATREEYLTYLRGFVQQHNLRVRTYEPVTRIRRDGEGFVLTSSHVGGERTTRCDAVVLAIGGTDFPNRLDIPGENLPHVDGYLREPHNYFGQKVLVVGGRNSAVEAALRCHHAGAHVALSYRHPQLPQKSIKYWLLPEIEGLIKANRIEGHFDTKPVQITPTHVTLENIRTGDTYEVAVDRVLSLIGYGQDKTLFRSAGVELIGDGEMPKFDPESMETNVPGLYVAGTAIAGTQSSKYKIFLENCHVHIPRIVAHLTGEAPPPEALEGLGESMRHLAELVDAQPES